MVLKNIDYFSSFRKIYSILYSNSSSSRAETIINDLSKLLLISLSYNDVESKKLINQFLTNKKKANESLIKIIKKISGKDFKDYEKFSVDDKSLKESLNLILNLELNKSPSHILGDAFQALIGPNLRGDKGQFFTPNSVVKCIIEILSPKPNTKLIDPASGTGGFITEAFNYSKNKNFKFSKLISIEKDKDLFIFSKSLLKVINVKNNSTYNFNSLDLRNYNNLDKFNSPFNADYVVTNPPFGSKIPVTEGEILKQFDFGYVWKYSKKHNSWFRTNNLLIKQDPQILFLELCIKFLKKNGKMAIILPEGVFGNKSSGYVWDFLRNCGTIFGLIDCPRTTFQPSTDIKTNILFFKKQDKIIKHKTKIAVALCCEHDRRGKKFDENLNKDDFSKIGKDWFSKKPNICFQLEIPNKYYFVPRYYDKVVNQKILKNTKLFNSKILTIGEMIDKNWIKIRKGNEIGSDQYGTGDIPFVRTSDISNFEISIDPTNSVSEEIYKKYSKDQNLKIDDILFVVDGRYRIGRTAILNKHNVKCIVQSHFKIISINKSVSPINAFEFVYLLSLENVQNHIRSLIFIQSTLGSIGSRIKEIKIPIPVKKDKIFINKVNDFKKSLNERSKHLNILKEIDSKLVEI
tara:strand:+ start:163 stop:2058 length:1896 start_codon:yes stop_codon:yes gene_type:complete